MRESDGEKCHEASILMKNGRNLTKGSKENQFAVSKIEFIKRPKGNNGPSKIGVSCDTGMQVPTGCQVQNDAVNAVLSNATAVDLNDGDKYELEIQRRNKKSSCERGP